VETFLISGSFEERQEYAGDILENQGCRIVLCSMQYTGKVRETLHYAAETGFDLYIQWLNPGYNDPAAVIWDNLGLVDEMLALRSLVSIRDGKGQATARVQEVREFIYGWAMFRHLIFSC
jgi:hypothetical protein